MRRRLLTGAAATAATVLALLCGNTATASAAGVGIGIDLVNDDNISPPNIQLCDASIVAVIGVILDLENPVGNHECVNSPQAENRG